MCYNYFDWSCDQQASFESQLRPQGQDAGETSPTMTPNSEEPCDAHEQDAATSAASTATKRNGTRSTSPS